MHNRTLHLLLISVATLQTAAQYQYDGVAFKTIPLARLDSALKATPHHLLIDVRSPGEFADTLSWLSGNIGHIDGAVNIPIDSMGERFAELGRDKDRAIFLYCSHSQRSRRVGKQLADSGFTNVVNVNEGLHRYWLDQGPQYNGLRERIRTNVPYKLISPRQLCERMATDPRTQLIDIRPDSIFRDLGGEPWARASGHLRGSINIPFAGLSERIKELQLDAPIIVVDDGDDDAPQAAHLLLEHGAKNVSVLFRGLWGLQNDGSANQTCFKEELVAQPPYRTLTPVEVEVSKGFSAFAQVIDVRTELEFVNEADKSWRNTGRVKGAVNIPAASIAGRITAVVPDKGSAILVYSFSGDKDAHASARALADLGYTNVTVLAEGIFGLRWTAANVTGRRHLNELVTDLPQ